MVTATMGPAGMTLNVDGVQVGSRTDTTQGEEYIGNWRLGGDRFSGQPPAGAGPTYRAPGNFVGSVDEVAIYPTALTASQILAQYQAATGAPPPNSPPTASFTTSTSGLTASVNATGSSDPDGEIVSWAWNFGDGEHRQRPDHEPHL